MKSPSRFRRFAAKGTAGLAAAASVACFAVGGFATVGATGETLSVTPATGLTNAQVINVSITTTAATGATVFIAVTQCGNATSAGVALTAVTQGDCVGTEGFGTSLKLIGAGGAFSAAGPVAAGTYSTSLTLKETSIGANLAKCLPLGGSITLPCTVTAATATSGGSYTGPNYNFQKSTSISFGAAPSTSTSSTSSTSSSSTSSTSSTSTSSTSSTSTSSTSTTSTTAPPPTTTTPGATTKSYTCDDIPLAASPLLLSKNRCINPGETIAVSAAAGAFGGPGAAFTLQCNIDPAIPLDGSGCNIGGLAVGTIGPDGAMTPTNVVVASGAIGSDARSTCPPSVSQISAGYVTCVIAAAPGGDSSLGIAAQFTLAGQTATLPVDYEPPTDTVPVVETVPVVPTTLQGGLPVTGTASGLWFMAGLALAVLDLGAVTSSYARRRTVQAAL